MNDCLWMARVSLFASLLTLLFTPPAHGDDPTDVRRWIDEPFDLNGDGRVDAIDVFLLGARFGPSATPTVTPTATPTVTPTPNATELSLPPIGEIQALDVQETTTTIELDFPTGHEAYLIILHNNDFEQSYTDVSIEWAENSWVMNQVNDRDAAVEEVLHKGEASLALERVHPPEFRTFPSKVDSSEAVESVAIQIGDRKIFDLYGGAVVDATLRYVGTHAAIYVDDENWMQSAAAVDQSFVDSQGELFDTVTFPTLTSIFGEASDVNGDGHIAILFTVQATTGGQGGVAFFSGGDLFKRKELDPRFPTNTMEVLYVAPPNTPNTTVGLDDIPTTIGHEFQHLINFYYHSLVYGGRDGTHDEEQWLNEGLSHLAQDYVGTERFSNRSRAELYLEASDSTGLLVDGYVPNNTQRGGAYLLCRYIADRFGDGILEELSKTGKQGIENIEAATGMPFADLTRDWVRAVFLSDMALSEEPDYNYRYFQSQGYLPGRWWGKPGIIDLDLTTIFFYGSLYSGDLPPGGFAYTILRNSEAGSEEVSVIRWQGPSPAIDVVRLPNDFLYAGYVGEDAWDGLILDQAYSEVWPAGEERVFSGRSADGQPFDSFEYYTCESPCNSIYSSWILDADIDADRFEFRIAYDQTQLGEWVIGVYPNGSRIRNRVEFFVVDP